MRKVKVKVKVNVTLDSLLLLCELKCMAMSLKVYLPCIVWYCFCLEHRERGYIFLCFATHKNVFNNRPASKFNSDGPTVVNIQHVKWVRQFLASLIQVAHNEFKIRVQMCFWSLFPLYMFSNIHEIILSLSSMIKGFHLFQPLNPFPKYSFFYPVIKLYSVLVFSWFRNAKEQVILK